MPGPAPSLGSLAAEDWASFPFPSLREAGATKHKKEHLLGQVHTGQPQPHSVPSVLYLSKHHARLFTSVILLNPHSFVRKTKSQIKIKLEFMYFWSEALSFLALSPFHLSFPVHFFSHEIPSVRYSAVMANFVKSLDLGLSFYWRKLDK